MMPLFLSCSMVGRLFRKRLRKFLIKAFRNTFELDAMVGAGTGGGPFGSGGGSVDEFVEPGVVAADDDDSKIAILSENSLNDSEFRFGL